MPLVMDERYYCPLARHLVVSLCQKVATSINSWYSDLDDNGKENLRAVFIEVARRAKEQLIPSKLQCNIAEMVTEDARPGSGLYQHSLIEKGYQAVAHNFFAVAQLCSLVRRGIRVQQCDSHCPKISVDGVVHGKLSTHRYQLDRPSSRSTLCGISIGKSSGWCMSVPRSF